MSAGYASRLSAYPNKGVVGLPESYDTSRQLILKLDKLASLVKNSQSLVVLTGAGISTASGIPDFRGPRGIWTLEEASKTQKRNKKSKTKTTSVTATPTSMEFAKAPPTLTHRAITKLATSGKLQYCVTQNVDGLHRRSGLSRDFHSPVHGCVFTEKCGSCGCEVFRDSEVEGLSFQPTGKTCPHCCTGRLHDILLDWEDMVLDLELVTEHCSQADLVLCLGTSLRIEPVASLPLLAKQFVIVNLQPTPLDEDATLIVRAKVDAVMEELMVRLGFSSEEWKDEERSPPIERLWVPKKKDAVEAFIEILKEKEEQQRQEQKRKKVKLNQD
mmetsp:Transcript_2646/g.5066  ORF Transcript_2646/g.5066 Transcript_2646/m.5066 type:complete len:329 (+) Transcript_2646:57-1043(+)|eukprot:CAMPEP_0178758156 /NCGR_PEP_ID=MMETSP0744-20121128/14209_1 /TAXON_ID=913974 /ORGANISM="Nitzschia punctata, Strain CCMP561" /LENGTH=328 /DNA_ID=CAMNT_0020412449 /DNA_START=25 /DNA_END=1011 /DNA_ORIENTATION=-